MKKTLCLASVSVGAMLAGAGIAFGPEAPLLSDQPPAPPFTVATGESLLKLSKPEADSSNRWEEMFALNRDSLASPEATEVGQVDVRSEPVTVPAHRADPRPSVVPAPAPAPVRSPMSVGTGSQEETLIQSVLKGIRSCESNGNYGAVSSNGRYRGAYQFEQQTWQAMGGSGDPAAAPPAEQDARARQLWSQLGSNPWPNCG